MPTKDIAQHLRQLMSYKGANFESFQKTWNFISKATSVKYYTYIKNVKVPRNELEKCLTKQFQMAETLLSILSDIWFYVPFILH